MDDFSADLLKILLWIKIPAMTDELSPEIYERVVTTPHNIDIPRVLGALDIEVIDAEDVASFVNAITKSIEAGGVSVVYCRTDAESDLAMIKKVVGATNAAIAAL